MLYLRLCSYYIPILTTQLMSEFLTIDSQYKYRHCQFPLDDQIAVFPAVLPRVLPIRHTPSAIWVIEAGLNSALLLITACLHYSLKPLSSIPEYPAFKSFPSR